MSKHPNEELIRSGYDAFVRGDIDRLRDLVDEEVIWHIPGEGRFSGNHQGKQAVLDAFRRMQEETQGTFKVEVLNIVAHGDHAVALTRLTASFGDRDLDAMSAGVFHIRDDKIREMWSLSERVQRGEELRARRAAASQAGSR